jgi:hypothetical protein
MYSEKRSNKTNVDDPPPHPGIKFHQDVTMDKTDIPSLSGIMTARNRVKALLLGSINMETARF